jgi:hypothetical protein
MNDFFENIYKNIIPLQNSLADNTNSFLDTFFDNFIENDNSNTYTITNNQYIENTQYNDEEYSDNFDSESDIEIINETQKQQIFDVENITTHTIEKPNADIDLILENLIILSQIQTNQKLYIEYINSYNENMNYKISIDNSLIPQVSRWYYNQNRINTINVIDKLIYISITFINYYKHINDNINLIKLSTILKNSIFGLNNLQNTYATDKHSCDKLILIINKINTI